MSKQDNIYNVLTKKHSRLHIGNIIDPIIKPFQDKFGSNLNELSIYWNTIVGIDYAEITKPIKISSEYKLVNGEKKLIRKLHIEVSGSNALEIKYNQSSILKSVNQVYGINFISDLVIKQNYKITNNSNNKKKNLTNLDQKDQIIDPIKAVGIKKNDLKSALIKLGSQIRKGKTDAK